MGRSIAVRTLAVLLVLTAAACAPASTPEPQARVEPVVVYLARHAEGIYPPPEDRNPHLNVMGQDRADALARLLSSEPIDHAWSTDYFRTQETIGPLAAAKGLTVESYDPRDLTAFAERLRGMPGVHVVLGHSNTTPELVGRLGGDPGDPIDEATEFDRLYVVTIAGDAVVTQLLRYGAPVPDNWEELASQRR